LADHLVGWPKVFLIYFAYTRQAVYTLSQTLVDYKTLKDFICFLAQFILYKDEINVAIPKVHRFWRRGGIDILHVYG
jgi:hypothetical protein